MCLLLWLLILLSRLSFEASSFEKFVACRDMWQHHQLCNLGLKLDILVILLFGLGHLSKDLLFEQHNLLLIKRLKQFD